MKKKLALLLVAVITALAVTTGAVNAVANSAQSESVTVTVPTDEPIRVKLVETSQQAATGLAGYAVYPGEPLILTYEISNGAHHGVDYIVELIPTIEGTWQQGLLWELQLRDAENFQVNPQGPAHLALNGGGGKQRVNLAVTWPRSITINPLPSASIVLNAFRTDCAEVEDCPWG